ncbi:MAG: alpha/beta hydrolase [Chloroflexi bacterium]|nr:alpha/beta hydrolase [Chloroflexota bacterium]
MRRIDQFIGIVFALIVIAIIGFGVWASNTAPPMPEALDALVSDAHVQVEAEPWWIFRPRNKTPTVGLIIYPGGRVDARAYAPTARAIAAKGYLVVITPMLLNLAFFGADRASQVAAVNPAIHKWAIAGHSLGGVAASGFLKQKETARGLVLWASYPADGDDLSHRNLIVAAIYGTRDLLAPPEKILAARARLPATTKFIAIEGGNHAQFGWYGAQSGDGDATIARAHQHEQIVNATIDVLLQMEHSP